MKTISRASLLLALGATCLAPSLARADELTTSPIHLHGADSGLVLEGSDDAGHGIVCSAPCDRQLDLRMRYRVNGDGVRPSPYFMLDPSVHATDARPGSSTRRTLGILFTVISVACIAPAIGLLVAAPSDRTGKTVMTAAGTSFLAGAASFGVAGPVLWSGSAPTQVTLLPQGRSARAIALPRISVSF